MKQTGLFAPTTLFALLIFSFPYALIGGEGKNDNKGKDKYDEVSCGPLTSAYNNALGAVAMSALLKKLDPNQKTSCFLKRIGEGETGKTEPIKELVRQAQQSAYKGRREDAKHWEFTLSESFKFSDALKEGSKHRFWEVYNSNKEVAGYMCTSRDDSQRSGFSLIAIEKDSSKLLPLKDTLQLFKNITDIMEKEPFGK